mmetsp:Transcript_6057/g.14595  ORF Transcript_6057/g.14595 Transcript_6057/m.14595 type:complete len:202 (-) Transcript_6057:8879-9484(-)
MRASRTCSALRLSTPSLRSSPPLSRWASRGTPRTARTSPTCLSRTWTRTPSLCRPTLPSCPPSPSSRSPCTSARASSPPRTLGRAPPPLARATASASRSPPRCPSTSRTRPRSSSRVCPTQSLSPACRGPSCSPPSWARAPTRTLTSSAPFPRSRARPAAVCGTRTRTPSGSTWPARSPPASRSSFALSSTTPSSPSPPRW